MDSSTCVSVDVSAFHFCDASAACHVPNKLRQTLPSAYKFGLKRTVPLPVVVRCTSGGTAG